MELYVLRHGIAEDQSRTGRDADRELTSEGRKKLRDVLRAANEAGVRPTTILTSPLVRAVQTAQLAADELGYKEDLVKIPELAPDVHPADTWQAIRAYSAEAQLLLASHNPLCAELTGYLLGSPNLQIDFKKGAIVRIDFGSIGAEPRGVLKWMLVPKLAG